jgi:hypothetical protein
MRQTDQGEQQTHEAVQLESSVSGFKQEMDGSSDDPQKDTQGDDSEEDVDSKENSDSDGYNWDHPL